MKRFALASASVLLLVLAVSASAQPATVVAIQIFTDGAGTFYYVMTEDGLLYEKLTNGLIGGPAGAVVDFWAGTGVTAPVGPLAYRVYRDSAKYHFVMLANGDTYFWVENTSQVPQLLGNFWSGTSITPTADMLDGYEVTWYEGITQHLMLLNNGDVYRRIGNAWTGPPPHLGNYWTGPPVPVKSATFGTLKGLYEKDE